MVRTQQQFPRTPRRRKPVRGFAVLAATLFLSGAIRANFNFSSSLSIVLPGGSNQLQAELSPLKSKSRHGLSAAEKLEAEEILANLGYWTTVDENRGSAFRHALIAFQKVEGHKRTGKLTRAELEALRMATKPVPRETGFPHVEVDLSRQVLFVVDSDGSVSHILPVSTGNEKPYMDQGKLQVAHTPRGKFKVFRKIRGWRTSTLGQLYYPNYIYGGIAIHGSSSVPIHAASHGCIRIPMYAAKPLSAMLAVGTDVIVYDG